LPVASRAIQVWHMPALTEIFEIFEDDSIFQFDRGTLGHLSVRKYNLYMIFNIIFKTYIFSNIYIYNLI